MTLTKPRDGDALFSYGTLMCPGIMAAVAGKEFAGVVALLAGYQRFVVQGEVYPGAIAGEGEVNGVLYEGIEQAVWQRLDAFEGGEYLAMPVRVDVVGGNVTDAWCYLFNPDFVSRLSAVEWDFGRFMREGRIGFLAGHEGFDRVYS